MARKTLFWRALRLRCPRCGGSPVFRGWFRMNPDCDTCGLHYERDPGYFLGSIYINYGLTALVVAIAYPVLVFGYGIRSDRVLWPMVGFCVLFPIWFFRYARCLWIAFDQAIDPSPVSERVTEESRREEA